ARTTVADEIDDVEDLGRFRGDEHQVDQHRQPDVRPGDVLEAAPCAQAIELGDLVQVLRDHLEHRQNEVHAQRRELPGVCNGDRDQHEVLVDELDGAFWGNDTQVH